MATSKTDVQDEMKEFTHRKYKDGDHKWSSMHDQIFVGDETHKCPTYVHQTPPCQGSCPSGEDIRGWLNIVRGIEKPTGDMTWQEYAFRRSTDANPFPSTMGRVILLVPLATAMSDRLGLSADSGRTTFMITLAP